MSSGYNDRLKPISYKGECGDKETEEPRSKWISKAKELAQWMKASKHTVVFTGVWTLEKQGKKCEFDTSFEAAKPSFTHYALVALMKKGLIGFIVSQNVDGLHLKSGVPRAQLSELHGNIFAEQCDKCPREYIRSFDVKGMGCSKTGRFCVTPGCGAPLRDKTIDWDSKLPDEEFEPAIANHQKADLALCLGTSLRIRPAGNMPLRTLRKHNKDAPGRLVIVNLQKTHLDRSATMRFHCRTDALMRELCKLLDVTVDEDTADAAAAATEAAAAEDARHLVASAAAAAAAAASPPVPRKVRPPPAAPLITRPTRKTTERLRKLYNPAIKRESDEDEDDDTVDDDDDGPAVKAEPVAAAASSSSAAAASSSSAVARATVKKKKARAPASSSAAAAAAASSSSSSAAAASSPVAAVVVARDQKANGSSSANGSASAHRPVSSHAQSQAPSQSSRPPQRPSHNAPIAAVTVALTAATAVPAARHLPQQSAYAHHAPVHSAAPPAAAAAAAAPSYAHQREQSNGLSAPAHHAHSYYSSQPSQHHQQQHQHAQMQHHMSLPQPQHSFADAPYGGGQAHSYAAFPAAAAAAAASSSSSLKRARSPPPLLQPLFDSAVESVAKQPRLDSDSWQHTQQPQHGLQQALQQALQQQAQQMQQQMQHQMQHQQQQQQYLEQLQQLQQQALLQQIYANITGRM